MSNEQQEKDFSVCSRLREERKALGFDQQQIADALEVNIKTVGRWERNIAIPSDKLAALADRGVDVLYVLTGNRRTEVGHNLTTEEILLLEQFRVMSAEGRATVKSVAEALASLNAKV